MTELDLYRGASLDDRWKYTRTLAAAQGLLPSSISGGDPAAVAARTFFVTETGDMLGIHPLAAIQGVNVIEGKPTLAPALMSALVRRAGHKIRVHRRGSIEAGDYGVRVEIVRADDPEHTFAAEWTVGRAMRAELVQGYAPGGDGVWKITARSRSGKPSPWEKYTEAMLYARALSECSREAAEDVLFGVHYTPEEVGAAVDGEGNVVEAKFEQQQQQQTQQQPAGPTAMPSERSRAAKGAQGVRRAPSAPAPAPEPEPASAPVSAPAPEPAPADPEPEIAAEAQAQPAHEADPAEPVDAEIVPDAEGPTDEPEPEDTGRAAVLDEPEAPAEPGAPSAFDVARSEEPQNWFRQAQAATTIDELQHVWYAAEDARDLGDDLKRLITALVQKIRGA